MALLGRRRGVVERELLGRGSRRRRRRPVARLSVEAIGIERALGEVEPVGVELSCRARQILVLRELRGEQAQRIPRVAGRVVRARGLGALALRSCLVRADVVSQRAREIARLVSSPNLERVEHERALGVERHADATTRSVEHREIVRADVVSADHGGL